MDEIAITVCNWNGDFNCSYCDLTLVGCTKVDDATGKNVDCGTSLTYVKTSFLQNNQNFTCYVFNNVTSNALSASTVGYGGAVSLIWSIPDIPNSPTVRKGLQVSFHEIGTTPNLFSETNFAITGNDNFFSLTKVITQYLKTSSEHPQLTTVDYLPIISDLDVSANYTQNVIISFAYTSLNVEYITQIVTKDIPFLLGDIGAMIGVLTGVDLLKAFRGLWEIPYSFREKSFRPIYENFN